MRIFVIIGTRPEAIKMLPLVRELKKHSEFEAKICFSSQHFDMAKAVFDEYDIFPDFVFAEMDVGLQLSEMTVKLLNYFDMIFKAEKPDLILVHGDTTTAFCASLSAFYLGIRAAHIEAGLRTFNHFEPFPEEFNRVSIDALCNLHFSPTVIAANNLEREGKKSVFTVGNTGIDALEYSLLYKKEPPALKELKGRKLLVITTHRRENLGEKMRAALLGIRDILEQDDNLFAILPTHPNPRVREVVDGAFLNIKNIKICEPIPTKDFHVLISRAYAVFTDSGGIQEEASYLGVPVFLLRENTERPEGVELGNLCVVGTERENIKKEFSSFMRDPQRRAKMRVRSLAFGDGHASERIVSILLKIARGEIEP